MKERLNKLKKLLNELKEESFANQYEIADWSDMDKSLTKKMGILSRESAFYQKILRELELINPPTKTK